MIHVRARKHGVDHRVELRNPMGTIVNLGTYPTLEEAKEVEEKAMKDWFGEPSVTPEEAKALAAKEEKASEPAVSEPEAKKPGKKAKAEKAADKV